MNYADTAVLGNYKKITISVPDYLYQQVIKITKPGEVSKFFAEAILNKISSVLLVEKTDPWDDFINARKHITKVNPDISIKEAISKGRL